MEYSDLLNLQSDDPFWNDGTFTNANEAWAIDPSTQRGIRTLAYFKRASEERRRLGWETRRSMRWAIDRHNQLKTTLASILQLLRLINSPAIPHNLEHLIGNPNLNALRQVSEKLKAVLVVIHSAFINHLDIQMSWHPKITRVLLDTRSENNDSPILVPWNAQLSFIYQYIRMGLLSGIPGDIELGIVIEDGMLIDNIRAEERENVGVDNDEDFEDEDEQEEEEQMENIIGRNLMVDLGSNRLHRL
jgi:hypothetical protein